MLPACLHSLLPTSPGTTAAPGDAITDMLRLDRDAGLAVYHGWAGASDALAPHCAACQAKRLSLADPAAEAVNESSPGRVQAAAAVRRLARLLYALHLLLEDGVLAPALKGSMHQADASLQQLAGLLHGALQDMATAFPQQAPIPSGNLHNFLKVAALPQQPHPTRDMKLQLQDLL